MFLFRRWLALGALGAGLAAALACTPQQMTDQPRLDPYAQTGFFANQASARQPVDNTLARGSLKDDPHLHTGKVNDQYVDTFPEPVTKATIERGRTRFNIFCATCHGEVGAGGGIVAQKGYPGVRGLHEDRLRQVEVGYLYDVIANGINRMPPYGHLMSPEDRWAIVAYVRALQLSQNATLNDVSPGVRARLEAERNQP